MNPQLHRLQSRPDSAPRRGGVWLLAASFGSQRLEVPFYTDTLINFCALLEKCHRRILTDISGSGYRLVLKAF